MKNAFLSGILNKLLSGYMYVFITIFSATYIQLILKWQLSKYGELPESLFGKLSFLFYTMFTNFYIITVLIAGGVSYISWMLAVKSLPLNIIYPMLSLCFVAVFLFSGILFKENMRLVQILGAFFILIGSVLLNQ